MLLFTSIIYWIYFLNIRSGILLLLNKASSEMDSFAADVDYSVLRATL